MYKVLILNACMGIGISSNAPLTVKHLELVQKAANSCRKHKNACLKKVKFKIYAKGKAVRIKGLCSKENNGNSFDLKKPVDVDSVYDVLAKESISI